MRSPIPIFTHLLIAISFSGVQAGETKTIASLFQPTKGWIEVASVTAVAGESKLAFEEQKGGGILTNGAEKDVRIPYLMTRDSFGDVRLEIEFMIPKGSNSGIYLMGRYEIQILDSFGKNRVGSGDIGGLYARHDRTRTDGPKSFGGIPPKSNASLAPGEWQKMEIVFRAPKFDDSGNKTSDATFEKVILNGVLVQENASTTGPTTSAPIDGEAPTGPIAIQGDHGPIAIRSFLVSPLDQDEKTRIAELDAYWEKVSQAVGSGDFESYRSTCHALGVLVSGSKAKTEPLSVALSRWQQEFEDTKSGKLAASVDFRFSRRLGDAVTAHESGIFLYQAGPPDGEIKQEFIHFEALLIKENDTWEILMENQIGPASKEEWDAMKDS